MKARNLKMVLRRLNTKAEESGWTENTKIKKLKKWLRCLLKFLNASKPPLAMNMQQENTKINNKNNNTPQQQLRYRQQPLKWCNNSNNKVTAPSTTITYQKEEINSEKRGNKLRKKRVKDYNCIFLRLKSHQHT